ncbi:hypothetical protein DSO57_1019412 [Entomophthora muscae]|uniref:Uncharacterized protein n=1 Tax=Entomophthora muscae TaxID=34485 RepID=A0ACC2UR47_9FUNG|nr:hypothetical protein DSO57_1019412 [Entomophthora muscae]
MFLLSLDSRGNTLNRSFSSWINNKAWFFSLNNKLRLFELHPKKFTIICPEASDLTDGIDGFEFLPPTDVLHILPMDTRLSGPASLALDEVLVVHPIWLGAKLS